MFIDASPVDHVTRLKQQDGGDIGVHGSITLAESLLRAGVVDELRLVVAPALAGGGRRLFEGSNAPQRLQLPDSSRTSAGNLLLAYRATPTPQAARRPKPLRTLVRRPMPPPP